MIASTQLGNTGHYVTKIGLGMAALGRPGYINLGHQDDLADRNDVRSLESHAQSVLTAAYDVGIRYFDTARSYGAGEEFLGRWLSAQRITDSAVTVSSKWGYKYVAGWKVDADVHEVKDHRHEHLEGQYAESRLRLGSHLDIYQIHSATLESGVLDDNAVLDRLSEIRDEGVTIGLSTSGPNQADTIRKALTVERGGRLLFGTVQATWNLLETSSGPALAEAHDAGLGTIIKESVANGRLTERDPATTTSIRAVFPDHNPDAIAMAAILEQPWVDTIVSGAATADQLLSNLGSLEIGSPVTGVLPNMAEEPAVYWHTRSDLAWT